MTLVGDALEDEEAAFDCLTEDACPDDSGDPSSRLMAERYFLARAELLEAVGGAKPGRTYIHKETANFR